MVPDMKVEACYWNPLCAKKRIVIIDVHQHIEVTNVYFVFRKNKIDICFEFIVVK